MTDMRYMNWLDRVVGDAVALIRKKTETYGDSWKRRGGAGAWFTTVRPWDRLEKILEKHDGNIFAALAADPSGQDGSALACVRDTMNYLILIEAHHRALMNNHLDAPLKAGTPEDGGQHASADAGRPQGDVEYLDDPTAPRYVVQRAGPPTARSIFDENSFNTQDAHIKNMVARFLSWKLPDSVSCGLCVVQPSDGTHTRHGTNLMTATEATQMIKHLLHEYVVTRV